MCAAPAPKRDALLAVTLPYPEFSALLPALANAHPHLARVVVRSYYDSGSLRYVWSGEDWSSDEDDWIGEDQRGRLLRLPEVSAALALCPPLRELRAGVTVLSDELGDALPVLRHPALHVTTLNLNDGRNDRDVAAPAASASALASAVHAQAAHVRRLRLEAFLQDDAARLVDALRACTSLRLLSLGNGALQPSVFEAVVHALAAAPGRGLQVLELEHDDAALWPVALPLLLPRLTEVTFVGLAHDARSSSPDALVDALAAAGAPALRCLHLESGERCARACGALAGTQLRELSITTHRRTHGGGAAEEHELTALARALPATLETLIIHERNCGASLAALLAALFTAARAAAPALVRLKVCVCDMPAALSEALAAALSSLRHIDWTADQQSAGVSAIAAALRCSASLESIALRGRVADADMMCAVAAALPHARALRSCTLYGGGYTAATPAALRALAAGVAAAAARGRVLQELRVHVPTGWDPPGVDLRAQLDDAVLALRNACAASGMVEADYTVGHGF